jgi:two-component system, NarL family, response regulator LiaR
LSKIRLVIVEDNDLMRDGLRTMFERSGEFEVVGEAEDGLSAVKIIEDARPNVVVMDIGLPGQDGIEVTRIIRRSMPDVRVVMLTAHNNDEEIFRALSAGAAGYCLKDCASERLKIAVLSVAEGAAWMDPRIAGKVLKVFENGVPARQEPQTAAKDSLLSDREKEVLRLMAQGQGNKEIAVRLSIGVSTVRTHVEHILEKLMVTGRTAAAVKAMKEGLI